MNPRHIRYAFSRMSEGNKRISPVRLVLILLVSLPTLALSPCNPEGVPFVIHSLVFSFTNDCVEGAKSLRFTIEENTGQKTFHVSFENWHPLKFFSGNPILDCSLSSCVVTWELTDMPLGETAICEFSYDWSTANSVVPAAFTIKDVSFYAFPPDSIGDSPPECVPPPAPLFAIVDDPSAGMVLRISVVPDSGPGAVVFEELQWVALPGTFAPGDLEWGDPELESLPWVNVTESLPYYLYPGAPALMSDIPDSLNAEASALLRYIISSFPGEQRLIWLCAADLPIAVESSTWGRMKDIFKGE